MTINALLLTVLLGSPAAYAAGLRVVATVPDVGEIAKRIGGDRVSVDTLARGTEDIHQIPMRPSFVTKLNRADAVVFMGLTIEHTFLPALLEVAANPRARSTYDGCAGPACIDCSRGVAVLEKPQTLSRTEGEIHPSGNPHYNLGPESAIIIARNISAGLSRIDSAHSGDYAANLKAFEAEARVALAALHHLAAPLKGLKAVSYHKDLVYLGNFTGLEIIDSIELKPGIAPTPSHLTALVKTMKEQNVTLILHEQHFNIKTSKWLAKQTGARIAVVGTLAQSLPNSESTLKLAEQNIKSIIAAAGKNSP